MAYAINWITKVVTIPLSDLTFVSGINYTLLVGDVHKEIRRLEWEFGDGLWAVNAGDWTDTQVLSGITYSAIFKLVNGYTWEVAASNIIVSLLGINSNLLDTFIPANGVSVLANNSGGKIDAGSGAGGLTPEQDATLTQIDANVILVDGKVDIIDTNVDTLLTDVAVIDINIDALVLTTVSIENKVDLLQLDITDVWKAHFHRRTWNKINLMKIYNVDGVTTWKSFDTNSDLSDIDPQ